MEVLDIFKEEIYLAVPRPTMLGSYWWELKLVRLGESGLRKPFHVRHRVVRLFASCWYSWALAHLKDHIRSWPLNEATSGIRQMVRSQFMLSPNHPHQHFPVSPALRTEALL